MSVDSSATEHQGVRSRTHVCQRVWSCSTSILHRLIARKKMSVLQNEIDTCNELGRSVTTIQLIGIGIGNIIGTGIFVLSGQAAAQYSGPSIIIAFIIAGIVSLLSALSMAEMSAMMPSCGSAYTYTLVAMGEYPAFMIGWVATALFQLGVSAVTVSWSRFVVHFIDLISSQNVTRSLVEAPLRWDTDARMFYSTGQVLNVPAIAISIAIIFLLIIGIRETVIVNLIFTVIKVIILLIFIFTCCVYVNRKNYDPFIPANEGSFGHYGITGVLHASTFVFFAYVGSESITTVAQQAKSPSRTLPLALIVSVIISLLIYVGVCTVMVGLVSYKVLNTDYPLTEAIKATPYGPWLSILLALGAIASLTTVAITILLAQTNIFYSMAHDGLLPPIFARLHHRTKTPWVSIIICGTIAAILAGICPVDILGETASVAALIMYLFVHICVIMMRYRSLNIQKAFEVPFGPWLIPVVGIILCILLLINTSKGTGIRFGIWIGVGHVIYFSYGFWYSEVRLKNQEGSLTSLTELVGKEEPTIIYTIEKDIKFEDSPNATRL